MSLPFPRTAVAVAFLSLGAAATAQPVAPAAAPAERSLSTVTVTGNPLGATELAAPVQQLEGRALQLREQPTLGETLSGLPGVSSTYFGPTASRPIIRGLDGDRIRILSNGGATHDVSSLSYDHAVAADPIAVERIEVLRGPGALLYGGSALGGVVNLIDNRIPREPMAGASGRADLGWSSGARARSGAVLVEGGNERIGLHVDAFERNAGDTRVPIALACDRGAGPVLARRLCNSQAQARGGAVGGSVFFDRGYLGASVSEFRTDYGSVAEDAVTLGMRSQRTALQGELRELKGPLRSVKLQAGSQRYRHTEFDDGQPGTRFRSEGEDLRIEARHAPIGPLDGVVGVQAERVDFSAQGDEAFAPPSRTRSRALFVHEELATGWGKLSFGGRREWVDVDTPGSDTVARFTPAARSFGPSSAAVGAVWNLAPAWQATANLARSARAPRDYELYANGPHLATGAYEVGSRNLGLERSTSVDLGLQWAQGPQRFRVGLFQHRFSNYIALLGTGLQRDEEGNGAGTGVADCGDGTSVESGCAAGIVPELAFQGVRARLRGLEAEGSTRLWKADGQGGGTVDLELRGDLVRGDNLTTGQPLPRIAPVRLGATLVWARGGWGARLGVDRWEGQDRVPAGDRAVGGYTLVSAALTHDQRVGPTRLQWFARLDNAANRLAYSATSFLTQSAPGRVPLPGRSLRLGVRVAF